MKYYYAWVSPSPGYNEHKNLYPNSTTLYWISKGLRQAIGAAFKRLNNGRDPILLRTNARLMRLPEDKVVDLLRHDAQIWGDTYDDCTHAYQEQVANNIYRKYLHHLEHCGYLDFFKPAGGLKI